MKKIFAFILIAGLTLGLSSCDKFFDSMEGDLSKVDSDALLNSENGLLALLADLYSYLPGVSMSDNDKYQMFGNGARDIPSYGNTTSGFWNYTAVRAVNNFLQAVETARENSVLDDETADKYKGEALFIRACYYFGSVRVYGGIPIVTEPLDKYYGTDEEDKLYVPRSTEKETWDWVLAQFEEAAELLPETQSQEMRATKYTAYGMQARAALWAASESKYWTRASLNPSWVAVQKKLTYMEAGYANTYYQMAIDAAKKVIDTELYGLYEASPSSAAAAVDNLSELFQNYKPIEGLLGRSYKTGDASTTNGTDKWIPNQWAKGYTGTGAANYAVTLNLADEYDYINADGTRRDGKIQTLVSGDENAYFSYPQDDMTDDKVALYKHYDNVSDPFVDKDPRFRAWILYPGAAFRDGTVNIQGGYVEENGTVHVYPTSKGDGTGNELLKTVKGVDYYPYGGAGIENDAFMGLLDNKNNNNRNTYSFSPRKYVDLKSNNDYVQSPYYDLRYAEVLLTYAEAVCESNQGDKTLAAKCLNAVRHRAGFKDDVALNIDNILHEWKVEFAFENKWSNVLYRRRGFYNPSNTSNQEEGTLGKKLTLIPLVDLSTATPTYIFLRALPMTATAKDWGYSGTLSYNGTYYSNIGTYENDHIEDNNK